MSIPPNHANSDSRVGRPTDLEKRAGILTAAIKSFFAHGYAATSIEQVAADAGVSKVTIYNHFGGKSALFTSAVEAECENIGRYFSIDPLEGATLRERLTAIGHGMSAFLSRPEIVQFELRIAAETQRDPAVGTAFLSAGPHRMKRAFSEMLKALKATGEVDIDDTDLAAEQFIALCKGMGDLDRRFGQPQDEARDRERVTGAVDMFCRAYARDKCD